jgi:L-alanine-DL-glutamate epimerase-like enolase superfamily enzyme
LQGTRRVRALFCGRHHPLGKSGSVQHRTPNDNRAHCRGRTVRDRWDTNTFIEKHLIDYTRVTLPNSGGISEFKKIASMCETHYIGMIPHFTGPLGRCRAGAHAGLQQSHALHDRTGRGRARKAPYYNEDYVHLSRANCT